MDQLIYTAMTGVKQFMEQQATVAHNLANVNTTGFKAQFDALRAVPVGNPKLPTTTQVIDETVGSDFSKGNLLQTGRTLDIALEGDGWISVQNRDGREAYTRAGNLKITENGLLQTASGMIVQGENGPITIPVDTNVVIDKDGAVSYAVPGGSIQTQTVIDRLKLVKFDNKDLARGDDGLFYASIQAEPPQSDPNLKVLSGFLESSNVNPVDAMVRMLSLSKQFDLQMEMLKNAQTNGAKSSQIMSLT